MFALVSYSNDPPIEIIQSLVTKNKEDFIFFVNCL